jgi:hypothetical protein
MKKPSGANKENINVKDIILGLFVLTEKVILSGANSKSSTENLKLDISEDLSELSLLFKSLKIKPFLIQQAFCFFR